MSIHVLIIFLAENKHSMFVLKMTFIVRPSEDLKILLKIQKRTVFLYIIIS